MVKSPGTNSGTSPEQSAPAGAAPPAGPWSRTSVPRTSSAAPAGGRAPAPESDGRILVGRSFLGRSEAAATHAKSKDEYLTLRLANRHGLVTGATGTGKTVTLQVLAEGFSRAGVPVFAADIKGDLSGVAAQGEAKDFLLKRAEEVGITYTPDSFPVIFWDMFGEQGHPVRATISEMGPLLLARLMGLNDTQEGVLNIVFRIADEQGLLLLDLKDLRAMLAHVSANAATLTATYGNVSAQSVGAIQRQLLVLENQGADKFFGEPALDIADIMRVDRSGYGTINILAADKLMGSPRLYACFLLWLLSELFERLPEVGDPDKPKLVFFFDEAHLLFNEAPKALLEKVEQVVRLIRSKGVGVYFVTQNPLDVPETVLAQLGNRVQHALRAFTPRDQKAVKAAAETFRPNPDLDTAKAIMELGKGEALVSMLEGNGIPSMVERTLIRPPSGRIGPLTPAERAAILAKSPVGHLYDTPVDRESAFEMLQARAEEKTQPEPEDAAPSSGGGSILDSILGGVLGTATGAPTPRVPSPTGRTAGTGSTGTRPSTRMSTTEVVVRQVARSVATQVGSQLGKAILRGILGSISKR
ncbi:helicase HerA-like C-terminal domain-containing protein [Xanthobacter sp. 91]|uniref:helicase HerA-like C-terminal domain-containing protein n=1 Tax=Xanthobacter sp. 91 TaxID=1117244 RepID=UPI0009DFAAF6|nr:helicase HerA-like C-terminal domain-containing protein [Xanthobacter sp. 91]